LAPNHAIKASSGDSERSGIIAKGSAGPVGLLASQPTPATLSTYSSCLQPIAQGHAPLRPGVAARRPNVTTGARNPDEQIQQRVNSGLFNPQFAAALQDAMVRQGASVEMAEAARSYEEPP